MLDKISHVLDEAFCVDNCYNLLYHLYRMIEKDGRDLKPL